MKILVSCGSPASGWEAIEPVLRACGVARAEAVDASGLGMREWHDRVLHAYEQPRDGIGISEPIAPSKAWEQLAVSVMLANLKLPTWGSSEAWGWADARSTWLLEFWRDFDTQVRFLLLYRSPEKSLAHMLYTLERDSIAPADAAACWLTYNRRLLRFYTRNSDRAVLANFDAAMAHLPELLAACENQIGLQLNRAGADHAEAQPPGSATAALAEALAGEALRSMPEAQDLFLELESHALSLQPGAAGMDSSRNDQPALCGAAWREYLALTQAHAEALRDIGLLAQGKLELEKRLHALEEERTQIAGARDRLQKQLSQAEASARSHEELLGELKARLTEARSEVELNLMQLHHVQDELQATFVARQTEEKAKTELQKQLSQAQASAQAQERALGELKAKLDQQGNEKSILQKELLQAQARVAAAEAQLAEAHSESELTLLQLHQVQEELEHYFVTRLEQEKRAKALEAELRAVSPARAERVVEDLDTAVFGFRTAELHEHFADSGYEHLSLRLGEAGLSTATPRSLAFKLLASGLKKHPFGEVTGLEFRAHPDGTAPFEAWPPETADAHGPYLKILPHAERARAIVAQLTEPDRRLLRGLALALPEAVARLQESGAPISRPWADWHGLSEKLRDQLLALLDAARTSRAKEGEPYVPGAREPQAM
jgi:hypothetical protein